MSEPKVVFWDLETLPDPRQIYERIPSIGAWPGRTFKAELQSIMCFGYKINNQPAECLNAWDLPGWDTHRHDDAALVHQAYEILRDADEIVTHNGKRFDLKVLNTRLILYGFPPLPKMAHVDTKVVLKSNLSLYSNSLADAAKFLGVSDKMHWGNKWNTWTNMAFNGGSAEERKLMADYCIQDVETLAEVYDKVRALAAPQMANRAQWKDGELSCPTCGNTDLQKHGLRRTKTKAYQRYFCNSCGSTCRTDAKDANPRAI